MGTVPEGKCWASTGTISCKIGFQYYLYKLKLYKTPAFLPCLLSGYILAKQVYVYAKQLINLYMYLWYTIALVFRPITHVTSIG
jgi:hypothetical protein